MTSQLPLPFTDRTRLTAASFLPAEANATARIWLADPHAWPAGRLALHGPAGVGKTHLLHAFAEQQCGILVPGRAVGSLVDMPAHGVIAVDDADAVPAPAALLHLLNAAAEAGLPVLLAGRTPPAQWPAPLPDLASRLRAITAVAIHQPDDALLAALLSRLLADRQLRVDEGVQAYLLARLPRHGSALHEAALRLDRASLAHGRRVTRAIAADVIEDLESHDF